MTLSRNKVLIVSEYDFYSGIGAAFERIKCYAKAVPEIDFLCINPFFDHYEEITYSIHSDINNLYVQKQKLNKDSFFYRNLLKYIDIFTPLRLVKYVLKAYPEKKIKILLYSSSLPLFLVIILFIQKVKKYTVIVEKNELERGIIQNIPRPVGALRILFYIIYPLRYYSSKLIDEWLTPRASLIITISSRLFTKYQDNYGCIKIPILVDYYRFQQSIEYKSDIVRYIYLGGIYENKDSLFDVLKAAAIIRKKNKSFRIDIIGTGNKNSMKFINSYISTNDLDNQVRFLGPVSNEQVPITISQYDYGLLLRNSNSQTEYGFSTKLGEYLAAGLPVIYTDISDNTIYLKDSIHGYRVPFSLNENLVTILDKANISTLDHRLMMKREAKQLALSEFNYSNYSIQLKKIFN